jgi:hypothetical protein
LGADLVVHSGKSFGIDLPKIPRETPGGLEENAPSGKEFHVAPEMNAIQSDAGGVDVMRLDQSSRQVVENGRTRVFLTHLFLESSKRATGDVDVLVGADVEAKGVLKQSVERQIQRFPAGEN